MADAPDLRSLRDLIDTWLRTSSPARAAFLSLIARRSKGNGLDHDPETPARRYHGKPKADAVRQADQALFDAIADHPGASTADLVRLTGAKRSTLEQRLRRLAGRGDIERGGDGRWKIREEAEEPAERTLEGGPTTRRRRVLAAEATI